jgi:hypothetical protein
VVLDTHGYLFGGFTPLEWESVAVDMFQADPSLKSFLFTLRNKFNIPPRRFALDPEEKNKVRPLMRALSRAKILRQDRSGRDKLFHDSIVLGCEGS